jgi:fructose/tagatose bisphosphate aldolase
MINSKLSAEFSKYIRDIEPEGITTSIGGEIGEVGKVNSTSEELSTYTSQFNKYLSELDSSAIGLSKISIQSGTSHGGVVLPDGTIAKVSVDFDTILELSKLARNEFGMAGAVQHGASTLPQEAFGKFVESEACEVHLATGFQNIFYDLCPEDLKAEIYAYLDENHSDEKKPDQTPDQFYYKSRKRAIGPFKSKIMALPETVKDEITSAWQKQFAQLFSALAIKDTMKYVAQHTKLVKIEPDLDMYVKLAHDTKEEEDVSDLAD